MINIQSCRQSFKCLTWINMKQFLEFLILELSWTTIAFFVVNNEITTFEASESIAAMEHGRCKHRQANATLLQHFFSKDHSGEELPSNAALLEKISTFSMR
ncbi:hypothetical protein Trydic_g9320 [Trypoxylus dichotomus]